MPVNEENKELRDLVAETLKAKGVLGKVQAEIRASVFLALEEQDVFKDKSPFLNQPLKDFVKTADGLKVLSLVREFLEFFNLEFTAMVFDPETHAGIDYNYEGRGELAKELALETPCKDMPLLAHLLTKSKIAVANDTKAGDSNGSSHSPIKTSREDPNYPESPELSNGVNGDADYFKRDHSNSEKRNLQSNGDTVRNVATRNDTSKDKPKPKDTTSLTSLSNLPPLNSRTPPFNQKGSDLKSLIDIGLNTTFEKPTDSDKLTKNGSKGSDSGESEIEEDIASHASNMSGVTAVSDDNTVDVSISKASGHGDYMEEV
uniref:FGFR1 oncogene partner n=1 Tax=Lygus hesperus TaxID=30085 RepID=A0A146KNB9_LYGHE